MGTVMSPESSRKELQRGRATPPRAVRCPWCAALARLEVRERVSEEEVAARYHCGVCRNRQTVRFNDYSA